MNNTKIMYFGELDLDNLPDYSDAEMKLNNRTIDLDLNFDQPKTDVAAATRINDFLVALPSISLSNQTIIKEDFEDGGTVKEYFDSQIGGGLIENADQNVLLSKLHLTRVGVYPDNEDYFAICDYTIGNNITNHMVVVIIGEDGTLVDITMES